MTYALPVRLLTLSAALLLPAALPAALAAPDLGATVNVGLVLEPTNLDVRSTSGIALDQILIDNVYQGLVSRTPAGKIGPGLASRYVVSDDSLTYTFTLRAGVRFHSGNLLTSGDVLWSLTQVQANAKFRGHDDLKNLTGISSPNAQTIVLKLSKPDAALLWNLTGRAGLILEKAATNALATTANGTGPYKLAGWRQGDSVTLTRNDAYWGRKAQVARVVFKYIPDANAAVNASLSGDLDVQTSVNSTLLDKFRSGGTFALTTGRTTDKYTLAFNNARAPLNDVRVRRALRQAIDHKAILAALNGYGVQQGGPIPQGDPGYLNLSGVDAYNPTSARKLLAQAGQSRLALTLTIPSFYGTTVADVLTSQFARVGVTLKVRQVEFASWLKDVYTNKDYELSYVNHAEGRDFGNWANPAYYFNYTNPKVQALYAQALASTSEQATAAALAQAGKLVAQDAPADWLYTARTVTAIRKGVTGFPTDFTSARLNLANLALSR